MTSSHSGTLGNISMQKITGYVNWGTASDGRMKKAAIRYTGFIAQEVEKAMTATGFEFSGLVKPAHDKDHYSLRYAEFVVPLVKATQELAGQVGGQQELIKNQEKENQVQQQKIEALQAEVRELKALVQQLAADQQNQSPVQEFELQPKQQARLSQNAPNPFQKATQIGYYLPQGIQSARLEIHAMDGKLLETIALQQTGEGKIQIGARRFPAGTYLYSLVVDNQILETRPMVLAR